MGTKFDQGWHHTTASLETLQKKLEEETATRRHEVMKERDVRIQEMTDVCGAVKAMQDLVFDVESTAMQRLEAGGRELDAVDLRLSELIQVQTQLRSETPKQQQQFVHVKGFQVDGVTDELRSVVQDLATIADCRTAESRH